MKIAFDYDRAGWNADHSIGVGLAVSIGKRLAWKLNTYSGARVAIGFGFFIVRILIGKERP